MRVRSLIKSPVGLTCKVCGKVFLVPPHDALRRRFCSQKCTGASMRGPRPYKSEVRLCLFCNDPFTVTGHTWKKRYCSNKCRGAWQSSLPYAEWRAKLSANTVNRRRGKDNHAWGRPPSHGWWISYQRLDGRVIRLRSRWEAVTALYLDHVKLSWEYEAVRLGFDGGTYLSDFYLPEEDVHWEVKGWFHEKHKSRIARIRASLPDISLVVITKPLVSGMAKALGLSITSRKFPRNIEAILSEPGRVVIGNLP